MKAFVIAVACLGALLWFWSRGGDEQSALPHSPAALATPGATADPGSVGALRSEEPEAWVEQLPERGVVRLAPDEAPLTAPQFEGVGRLAGEEAAFARGCLDREVDKQTRKLARHRSRVLESWQCQEERALEEATLVRDLRGFEAYREAFERGSYFLVLPDNEKPPLQPDVIRLNVGLLHEGKRALMVVVVRKTEPALVEADRRLAEARHAWLQRVAYDFNSKPDGERRALVRRWQDDTPDDRTWREQHFPSGVVVDPNHCVMSVPR